MRIICLFTVLVSLILALPAKAAVMLIYHHVADDTPRVSSVTANELRQHLQYFKDNNFQVIGLDVLINQLRNKLPIADNSVVITFDDSFENNYTTAHPILMEFGFPYTIFISPGSIDNRVGPVLSWDQVRKMAADGVLVANHSMNHEHMTQLEPGESMADWHSRIKQNILDAEGRILTETGQSHKWLAYPYGEFNSELEALVKALGFIGIGQQSGAIGSSTKLSRVPRYPAAGQYADLANLGQKLRTLAFDITYYLSADQQISDNPPTLRLQLKVEDFLPEQLRCYAGTEVLEPIWLSENTFEVTASKPVKLARSRYNCTAPSLTKKGYFYWYSQPWLNN
ncbi:MULTISPECIES: polysaccharide deacetylase family protein [unclassified Arsukibacterium]|uniref:polysaccharide deacetylase family protein n=1 Tax=unclassified Arsukibacterium TaxID=2635278 RepID=UPI000C5F2210|nr:MULTISPECIES: polysaccharide deacetylase family protein [unclassified Arsukibacterium]MAA94841.1 xylanase [Rheinheimera sp.]MBM34702.1 xylanase [Rheinheimera sp.]HAW93009.1 xylanase [Candidatus Azambacteria bacterium]|tara:strand:- start:49738 stop:50757 length:1020 start_codon:yes stop_codon:yes gene_type:complete